MPRALDDVPAEQRLAAHQKDKADAQCLRLVKHGKPFLRRQLIHGRAVLGGMDAARKAPRAVQIAARRNAGNQERGNMPALTRSRQSFLGSRAAGGGKPKHERAFLRIFQSRLDNTRDNSLDTFRQILLEIKFMRHFITSHATIIPS